MVNKKPLLIFGIMFGVLIISLVAAIWIVSIRTSATYNIESDIYGGLVVTKELSGSSFDTLANDLEFSDEFIFNNEGTETDMNITVQTNRISTNVSCTNWENDCEVEHYLNNRGFLLDSGSNVETILRGQNKIVVNVSCMQYSCPQSISTDIEIEKLPV